MKGTSTVRSCLAVVAAITLAGCAEVPLMPDNLDTAAKAFAPPPGKSNLYITRTSGLGMAILFTVHLDGKLAGSVAPQTFLLFEVQPGPHQVVVITQENQEALTLKVDPGSNYFVDVVPRMGWVHARAGLAELKDEEGRAAVKSAKRAEPLLQQ